MRAQLPILESAEHPQSAACGSAGRLADPSRMDELRRELLALAERGRKVGPRLRRTIDSAMNITLSLDAALPLVNELTDRDIDTRHVWVGVREGTVAVLDDDEHAVASRLRCRATPSQVRDELVVTGGLGTDEAWSRVSAVISRLAAAGMVEGLHGFHEYRPPTPERFARFHLTKACQLECEHCYADSSPYVDRTGELPTARWLRIVDEFAANGGEQVLFTGGEALIHRGCLDVMEACKTRGLYVTLFTNGILVPRHSARIHALADKVQVSLDGPDAETNDAVRGAGTFRKIIRALDVLAQQGTPTRIGMTVVPAYWDRWKARFLEIVERYGNQPHVEFKLSYGIMQYGRGSSIHAADLNDPDEIDRFLNRVNGHDGPKVTRVRSGCGYGEQLVIGPSGEVYPCHLLDAPICHVDDAPVADIIDTLRGLVHQVDVDHVEGCSSCEIRYLCGGGCRVLDSRKTGSRLITTCTPADKLQKYRNLVRTFAVH